MRKIFLILLAAGLSNCNPKKNEQSTKQENKKPTDTAYVISGYGIGPVKIGMTQDELEKLLNQKLVFKHTNDADAWSDTAIAKYKDIEVSLFFQQRYNEDQKAPKVWELSGLSSVNALCKTMTGIGIGDDKVAVISSYDDNFINMGPQYEQVNDSTWLPSKTKYMIHISNVDDENELFFILINKKIASMGVSVSMGD
jgi:transposase